VEDLQFLLQDTDEKVALFLQTLSSMHEAFSSDSAEATPMEEPSAAPGEGHDKVQRSAEMGHGSRMGETAVLWRSNRQGNRCKTLPQALMELRAT
jgi:hypothetical protein